MANGAAWIAGVATQGRKGEPLIITQRGAKKNKEKKRREKKIQILKG